MSIVVHSSANKAKDKKANKKPDVVFNEEKIEDVKYLKKYFKDIDWNITHDRSDPTTELAQLNEHLTTVLENRGTAFSFMFLNEALPRVVSTLLERSYPEPEWQEEALTFVRRVVESIVNCINDKSHSDDLLGTLEPIFTKTGDFYRHNGAKDEVAAEHKASFLPPAEGDARPDGRWGKIEELDTYTSIYYARMIDYFGEIGGFDAILNRIQDTEDRLPSGTMLLMCKFLEFVKNDVIAQFWTEYVAAMGAALKNYFNTMEDSDMREAKLEDLEDAVHVLVLISNKIRDTATADDLEIFKLDMALKYVQLPYIEPIIKGIEQISHMIQVAQGKVSPTTTARAQKRAKRYKGSRYGGYGPYTVSYTRARSAGTSTSSGAGTSVGAQAAAAAASRAVVVDDDYDNSSSGCASYEDWMAAKAAEVTDALAANTEANAGAGDGDAKKPDVPAKPRTVVTTEFMLNWLQENDMISVVLSLDHPEAIRKGSEILIFLAKETELDTETINTMWAASKVHESQQKVVFELFTKLLATLPIEMIDFIYDKVEEIPVSAYNQQVLSFIADFTSKGLEERSTRNLEPRSYGLDIFFGLVINGAGPDGTPVDPNTTNEACTLVQAILKKFPDQRETFVAKVVDGLGGGDIASVSLKLLSDVVRSYPSKEINATVVGLEEKYQLVNAVLTDLANCKAAANEAAAEAATESVKARLAFLEFILTESELSITADQADSLWDSLTSIGQSDVAYEWLTDVQYSHLDIDPYLPKSSKFPAFSDEVVEHLFLNKMNTIDAAGFTTTGLTMYSRYFVTVNSQQRFLRRLGIDEFQARSVDLVGLGFFRDVALDCNDEATATASRVLLENAFDGSSKRIAPAVRAWRVAATRDLMAVLESSKGDETKLRRAVTLLTNLVRKDAKAKAKAAAGEATPGSVLTNEYFDTMFAMLSDPELGRRVWELLMLCPTHEATRANVSSLETSGDGEGFAKLSFAQNLSDPDAPEYIFQLLYLVQVIHGLLLSDETWRGAFIAADGVAFLAHIFQTQDFLNPKHGQYGRMVASYLVETLRILREADQAATTAAFSPGFVHHVLDQISVLASQPILKVAIDDAADEEAAMAADEAKEAKAAASKKRGTRIADCHYSSNKSVLKFDVTGNRYRVSAYVVDYNTFKRTQHLKAWLGEDEPDDLPKKQWLRGNKASAAAAAAAVESDSDDDEGDEGAGTGGDGAEAGEGGEAAAPAEPEAKPDLPPIIEVAGRPFHNGQWLSWDVDGEGVFNITIDNTTGPNWVLSAVMIDRYGGGDDHLHDGAEVTAHPRFVGIDSTTKGKWIGTYGEFGGVQLGIKDNLVPVRPGSGPNAPRLAEYDTGRVEKYEWIKRLTTDNRGMQQAPHPDQMDFFSSDDEGEEASGDAGASAGGASASDGPAGSSGAGDAAASAGDENDDDDDKEVELPETSSAILNLLFSSASSSNEIMGAFLGYPSLPTWIFDSIVKCQDSDLRSGIVTGLIEITGSHPDSAAQLLDGLLPFVSQLADHRETAVSFDAYFSLLSSLLEAGGQYDAGALLDQLTDLLRDHPIVESEDEPDVVDTELIGILKVLTQLLVSNPDLNDRAADPEGGNLVNEVFGPCLFDAPESRLAADVPKCKSDAARDAGFVLLAHLASMVPAAQLALADKLSGHLQTVPLPTGWAIDVTKAKGKKGVSRGSETGWTGLKNQGCTCYMNATLQQLFVLPGLRRDILNVPQPASIQAALAATPSAAAAKKDFDAKKEGGEEKKEGGEAEADAAAAAEDLLVSDPKQNTMYQLQKLFALMTQAKSSWVDTIDFCKTVRLGGEVINVRRQEDANEFFNTLADSLEPYLAGTPQETMFRDSFGGSFLHQIISEDCIHSSERAEDFLTVSIKVQNKRNVDESLKFLIEADRLDGNNKYKCDQCDDHVVARKRQVIQHLPNTLILHLKRFEFSFETFQNVKVYDRFEFPETLNMKAFTKEGLAEAEGTPLDPDEVRPDDYYEYELKGVLIHSGTANSGHYYSYIQERNEDGEEARWFEFNDRRVSPFNTRDIDDQCFGGNYSQKSKHPKSHSAYMLFYDRKTKYPARTYDIAPAAETPAVTDGSDNAAAADEGGAEVSSGILDTIWQQGVNNARQRQLMSMACFEFMWRCVTVGAAEDPVMEWRPLTEAEEESRFVASVKLATKIVMDIMSHCVDNVQIAEKFATLQSLYERHLPLSHWLFGELASAKSNWTLNILLNCPDKSIRNAAVSLVQHLFESAYAIERPTYAHAEDEQPSAFMVMFIYKVITLLHAAASKPTHRIQQLLAVLLAFARIGTPERAVLLERNAVADLIALFTAQKTPLIMRQTPYKFRNLLETLAELVCGADNPHHLEHQGEEGVPEATGLELKAMAHSKTFDRRFLNSVIQTATDVSPVVRIIEHWAWGDQPVSNIIIGIAISGADTNVSASSRKVYYHILARLCALNDPEREWRLATMFKLIFDKIRVNIRLPHFRNAFSTFVLDMAEAHPDVAALAQASEVFATLVQTRTEMQTWLRLKHHDRFCALFPDWAAHIQPKAKPAADGSDEDDGGDEDGGNDATADAPGNGTGGSVSDNEAGDPSESVAAALADDGANSA